VIPDTITWGHVLMLAGLLAGLYALVQLVTWLRYRGAGHGRGTPGYARARDARRYAIWSAAAGALLYAAGCFSPLCDIAIAGS
jgi:hypothetical protein